ncbi:hypothetical protein [Undibacterium sp. Di24W]|uniref:hypothetical protein n=1 Tax=Undibacterium sp. Di24W TaxID=3413033 RepID=UPI003BF2F7B6
MAEVIQYLSSVKEMTEIMIKAQGIHEGLWAISIEFGFVATMAGPTPDLILPSGVISVSKIGIQKVDNTFPMHVDAAAVNPAPKVQGKVSSRNVKPKVSRTKKAPV